VGQGDARVVATGPGAAIVVDAGPEPAAVDGCLTRLGVERVDLLVLTHFHADHVAGVTGVLAGRVVDRALVSPLPAPAEGAAKALGSLEEASVAVATADVGQSGAVGEVSWTVVGPDAPLGARHEDEGANDASVVLLMDVAGLRLLATGDVEPGAQQRLGAELERLGEGAVDVLKVAHHGSAHQDAALHHWLAPRLALLSVGDDNDYGHPAPAALALLDDVGALVARTDRHGDVAVGTDGGLWVSGSRRDPRRRSGRVTLRRRGVAGCGRGSPQSTRPHVAGGRARAGGARHRDRGPPR
jgi:competence protein ComEC